MACVRVNPSYQLNQWSCHWDAAHSLCENKLDFQMELSGSSGSTKKAQAKQKWRLLITCVCHYLAAEPRHSTTVWDTNQTKLNGERCLGGCVYDNSQSASAEQCSAHWIHSVTLFISRAAAQTETCCTRLQAKGRRQITWTHVIHEVVALLLVFLNTAPLLTGELVFLSDIIWSIFSLLSSQT